MNNGWTAERRARQRAMIQQWRPWEKSTGPRTDKGKAKAAGNSLKHGGRSLEWRETLRRMRDLLRQQRELLHRVR
jgi:hypothetical protein